MRVTGAARPTNLSKIRTDQKATSGLAYFPPVTLEVRVLHGVTLRHAAKGYLKVTSQQVQALTDCITTLNAWT